MKEIPDNKNYIKQTAYQATSSSMQSIKEAFPEYTDILNMFNEGVKKVELRKRYMLKKIDEVWVRAFEDTLPSIDVIIRHPGVLLQEKEEVLPVELTRKITGRSVEYLSQHTDMINEIRDDGMVVPSKILNVFQDDTVLTYENKFINTLINRMYAFVAIRYDAACECGEDEKNTSLSFNQEFERGDKKGKISLSIELSEPPKDNESVKNYIYTSDLWKRVMHVKKIVDSYMSSPFVAQLGRNYVRPPIMRTNKLLKNVEFRQCLSLWEFLESYENTGYETLISEDLESVSEDCIRDYYNSIAEQYVLFQKHIVNEFEDEHALDRREIQDLHPHIKDELDPLNEREYDYRDVKAGKDPEPVLETGEEDKIEQAIKIALAADEQLFIEEKDKFSYKYRYSFLARLILAQKPTQDFYTAIKNELLSYRKVKSRTCWSHETFSFGRSKCARVNVKGKTLYLYLPLNVGEFIDSKYHLKDVSSVKKNKDLPALLKVKSERGVKYAKELIAIIMQSLGIEKMERPIFVDYSMPVQTIEQLLKRDLVRYANGGRYLSHDEGAEEVLTEEIPTEVVKDGILYRYRYSFISRIILAQNPTQDFYEEIKNELLTYKKVKDKLSWGHESFTYGRNKCARLNARGKTLFLYLPLNADKLDPKYHAKDVSDKKNSVDVPTMLKIKSARAVKYAKELIALVMERLGVSKLENVEYVNYHKPYESVDKLVKKGLVKLLNTNQKVDFSETEIAVAEEVPTKEVLTEEIPTEVVKDGILYRYRYSFISRIILAQNPTQDFYEEIKNELLTYKKVKDKLSWGHESFTYGRNKCARLNARGKTLFLYLPLDAEKLDPKYHAKDVSDKKNSVDVPTMLKIKSARAVKYAKELIALVMERLGVSKLENVEYVNYHKPYESVDKLVKKGLVKLLNTNQKVDFSETEIAVAEEVPTKEVLTEEIPSEVVKDGILYRYSYSFTARLCQADKFAQGNYSEIKNYLLSYKKVRDNTAWSHETFRYGRNTFAKIKVRGKTVNVYLAVDPDIIEEKYHVKNLKKDGKEIALPSLLKVKSARGVKYAKELIDLILSGLNAERSEDYSQVDYTCPYKSTEELLKQGKVKFTKSSK